MGFRFNGLVEIVIIGIQPRQHLVGMQILVVVLDDLLKQFDRLVFFA